MKMDYWILHIRISLSTNFQLKLAILIFLDQFARKGISGQKLKKWTSSVNSTYSNCSKCLCLTVSLSTQILILAIVPLLFSSVRILCEFAMLLDVYILLSPWEEEVHCSSWGNRCTNLVAHSSKRLNPLSVIILVCLGNTRKNKSARQTALPLFLLM